MKTTLKFTMVIALSLVASVALAFHGGGVAECAGCHTMHNSQDGAQVTDSPIGYNFLLIAATPTDVCLSCHAAYGQMDGGLGYGPGGDFYWVTKTWTWEGHHGTEESLGDSHGHNVISAEYGINTDQTLATAPGGDFMSSRLACTSCHDPHGNQNFRLLYGTGAGPRYDGTYYTFVNPAPLAKGNSRRTTVEGGGNETDAKHTVYKNGMSEWCANCHPDFLTANSTSHIHPAGETLGSTVAAIYNAYISTADPTGGDINTAYRGLVPFEAVNVDLDNVDSTNYTMGPDGVDKVACVSCHRAHASPFSDITRWDTGQTYIADSHPQATDGGATADDVANKYYQYTFTEGQRSLCNKCHVKDLYDRI